MSISSDDRVGYGEPPRHSRFQKRRSGNPRGPTDGFAERSSARPPHSQREDRDQRERPAPHDYPARGDAYRTRPGETGLPARR